MGRTHHHKAIMEAEVMEAAAAARQLVELRGDDAANDIGEERKEEMDGHRPSTPPAIGSAPSGRRRDHFEDDIDDDDKEEGELGQKRRKRYMSIRTIYRRTQPILMEPIVSRKRKR